MQRLYPTKAFVVLGAWLLSAAAVCSAAEVPAPPVAPIQEVTETLHGVTLTDPYRYLENLRAPQVQEWFKGQGAYARATLDLYQQGGSLDRLLWQFVDGRPRTNRWRSLSEVPAITPEAEALSKELKRRGFRFIGPTVIYAHMQATGMVNDHLLSCPRHAELEG